MNLFRIGPEKFLDNYTGRGGSFQDGARWNSAGKPVLYFSAAPSVAMLEMANYIPDPDLVPDNYRLAVYEIPDDIKIEELPKKDWPTDWNTYPHPASTQAIGDEWLDSMRTAFLKVPCSAIPAGLESIYVANPLHPDIGKIKLVALLKDIYSDRLFKDKK